MGYRLVPRTRHTLVASFYKRKRDVFEATAREHLAGVAEWNTPEAGLFFYTKFLLPPGADSYTLMRETAVKWGVLALPGVAFMPSDSPTQHARLSFRMIEEGDMTEACRRLRAAILEVRGDTHCV